MLTDKQESFIHFEKDKLSDSWQEILNDLLESEKNRDKLYNRLELAEVLLSECLEILTFLASKKANRTEIKETMESMDLSEYAGGYMFSYGFDAGIEKWLKLLSEELEKCKN